MLPWPATKHNGSAMLSLCLRNWHFRTEESARNKQKIPSTTMEKKKTNTAVFINKDSKSTAEILKENPREEISLQEKKLLSILQPEQEALPYPLRKVTHKFASVCEMKYVIPKDKKEEVLKSLFPFENCPEMEDTVFDIHERKYLKFKECGVIRYNNRNMIVSKYFSHSGGMAVDLLPKESANESSYVASVK